MANTTTLGANTPFFSFNFVSRSVRVQLDSDKQPWFNAGDVCEALEFANPRQAVGSHVDGDDVQKLDTTDNLGRSQRQNHINESGLYALIFGSTKPVAKKFKRWLHGLRLHIIEHDICLEGFEARFLAQLLAPPQLPLALEVGPQG